MAVLTGGAVLAAMSGRLAVDFRLHFLPAATDVIHGRSPYSMAEAATGHAYVYPPELAFLLTPFTLLPPDVAALLALGAIACLLFATLWILGVRDPLCYLAVFLWTPVWQGFDMGSITALLAYALAVTWRYRDETWRPALAFGLAAPTKFVLWPLAVWMVGTRRLQVSVYALAIGLLVTFGSWAVIAFQGFADYPSMLGTLDGINASRSYSMIGLAASVGWPLVVGSALAAVVGGALLIATAVVARKGNERDSFFLSIAAALVLTPILWLHYLTLLVVPLAIARPRFSPLWLLPILLWVGPDGLRPDGTFEVLPLLVASLVIGRLVGQGVLSTQRSPSPATVAVASAEWSAQIHSPRLRPESEPIVARR